MTFLNQKITHDLRYSEKVAFPGMSGNKRRLPVPFLLTDLPRAKWALLSHLKFNSFRKEGGT